MKAKKLKKTKKIKSVSSTLLNQPLNNINSAADIIFNTGPDGSIRFRTGDGEELLELGTDYIAVLGEKLDLQQVRKLIKSLKDSKSNCSCSSKQLLIQGCTCGNA